MKLSPQAKELIESFFRQYFGDASLRLPEIQVYSGRAAWVIVNILNIDGITVGRHIFIRPGIFYRNSGNLLCVSKQLLVHEITHSIQYQKQGFFGFLFNYVGEYLKGIKEQKKWDSNSRMNAYLNISHEIEARESASEFINWFNLKKT